MKNLVMTIKLLIVALLSKIRGKAPKIPHYGRCVFRLIRRLYAEGIDGYYHVGKAFLEVEMNVLSDNLKISSDPMNPILIVVVKDDLLRMQLIFKHYRSIGISQFVVLDNGSTDGTVDFCTSQEGTRVYHVATPYDGNRKEGWVERVIRSIGVDRWYIVVDSDEMLDYPGREQHPVQALIVRQSAMGNKRLYGYMLDMYSDKPLYSVTCTPDTIPQEFCWFDDDTYSLEEALYGMKLPMGGPRQRMTGNRMWAGKCPVFLFDDDMNILSAHFMQPIVQISKTNLCCVLRHYKYLSQDKAVYQFRESQSSGFAYTTVEYKAINEMASQNQKANMYCENSKKYKDSYSLTSLPLMYSTFQKEA